MTLIQQPRRSKVCGQACVAMVAGLSLAESIKAFGHSKGTTVAGLRKVLARLGFKVGYGLTLVQDNTVFPALYIAQVKYPRRRRYHWVVFCDGALYDPSWRVPHARKDGRVNAYLEIGKIVEGKDAIKNRTTRKAR